MATQPTISLDVIRDAVLPLLEPYGVRRLVLFGSRSRDDARPDSDVDLFVEFDEPRRRPLGFAWIGLAEEASELLGVEVQLVSGPGCHRHLLSEIARDGVVLYDSER